MTARLHRRAQAGLLLLLALALPACQSVADGPRAVPTYGAEDFFATTSIFGSSFSADGEQLLVTSDQSGVFNVYSMPVVGGPMTQLTHSTTDAIFSNGWFRHDDRFLYTADQGGNELNHVYVREPDGTVLDLTPGEELKASMMRWSDDGRSVYLRTNERDPEFFDLYRYDVEPTVVDAGASPRSRYPRQRVYQNPGGYELSDVSPNGGWVALTRVNSNSDSDIFVTRIDPPSGLMVHVTPHEGDIEHAVATFSPDSRTLYYQSNEGSEFQRVWSYDLQDADRALAYEAPWDVSSFRFSQDGRYWSVAVNADARTELRLYETATGRQVELPTFPAGDVAGVSVEPGGDRMVFRVNGDTSPTNLYLFDPGSDELTRLTDTLNPAIDAADLVEAVMVRYPSFDGLEIPAVQYKPHAAAADNPAPALVWVHGGPGGQSRGGYNPMIQHLVNHGYAVLAVNNRGSSGYGKTFFHLDDRKHGDVDLQDCIYGRRYLESLDWVDGERVGIIGGSYGGYMVCAALAFEPDAFDVGIDIFGVTNWLRTLESIPPWWADFREALYAEMGDPVEDRDRLHAKSPLFHASNITKPMLVVQGANDPRVLQAESDEMVEAVRANGVPVEYVLFEDEGHGFRSKANRIAASNAFVNFLDEHLKAPVPEAPQTP